jgi:PAS domain S-box-containing protein
MYPVLPAMEVQFPLVAVPLALTTAFCGLTAGLLARNLPGDRDGERSTLSRANEVQTMVLVMLTLWAFGQLVAVTTTTRPWIAFGLYLTMAATIWAAASWLAFALLYTGRERWVSRRTAPLFLLVPIAATMAIATAGLHESLLLDPTLERVGDRWLLDFAWGPGTFAVAVFNWIAGPLAIYLLFQKFLTSRNVYRKISFVHVVGGSLLVGGAAMSMFGLSPLPYLVLGSTLFSAVILVSAPMVISYRYVRLLPLDRVFALFSDRFRNLAPVARDTIIQEMHSGVLVVDPANHLVDLNPLGRRMIGAEDERVVGKQLTDVVPRELFASEDTRFLDPDTTDGVFRGVWVEPPEGDQRCFDIVISGLTSGEDLVGRVALINDVTDREIRKDKLEQRTRELERQNEQLDQFAGIVSHDLRNPLTVAKGYLQTAKDEDDADEYIAEAEASLDRMEAIIDDVLTLAREGQSIGETESVSLGDTARAAWENVDTDGADLVVATDGSFAADPDRLPNLFENLFRNAREHGDSAVTVTVGWDDDAFYVADDGPGIPPGERSDVLEFGYTTAESGTGFGLAIVRQVADAHGWTVDLTASDDGGARFEFDGVDRSPTRVTE